jgi:hypothetical protein
LLGPRFRHIAASAHCERGAAIRRFVTGRPERKTNRRRFGAWLALLALALQIGFGTAHSARHFDHLVGYLGPFGASGGEIAAHGIAAGGSQNTPPAPTTPKKPDLDHCAIGLGLLASVSFLDAGPAPLPVPTGADPAHLEAASATSAPTLPPHFRPPPRAPPVIGMSA